MTPPATGPLSTLQFTLVKGVRGWMIRMYCPLRQTWVWRELETKQKPTALRRVNRAKGDLLKESAQLAETKAKSLQKLSDELYKLAEKLKERVHEQEKGKVRRGNQGPAPQEAPRDPDQQGD